MLRIADLLTELKKTIEAAQAANDNGETLQLSYFMGMVTGNAMIIHEVAKENDSVEIPK